MTQVMNFWGEEWEAHLTGTVLDLYVNGVQYNFYAQSSIIEAKAIIKAYCPDYSILNAEL